LLVVEGEEFLTGDVTQIQCPASRYDSTHLEHSRKTVESFRVCCYTLPFSFKFLNWDEEFCGDSIAECFDIRSDRLQAIQIRHPFGPNPQMSQFVGDREHLGALCVLSVDEDKRGDLSGQSESPEFIHVQSAMSIVAHYAVDNDHYVCGLNGVP